MGWDGNADRAVHGLVWGGEGGHGVTILAYPRNDLNFSPGTIWICQPERFEFVTRNDLNLSPPT
jgi:hypothetical protein